MKMMGNRGLYSIIENMEEAGELIRVKVFVNLELEITETTDQISKKAGGGIAIYSKIMEQISAIDKKWDEFELGELIQSPSLKFKNLVKGEGAIRGE